MQQQLAEYERRRAGGTIQMGIDVSDILGRNSDDGTDYDYDKNRVRLSIKGLVIID